jgi:hypothetical protein
LGVPRVAVNRRQVGQTRAVTTWKVFVAKCRFAQRLVTAQQLSVQLLKLGPT